MIATDDCHPYHHVLYTKMLHFAWLFVLAILRNWGGRYT